MRHTARPYLWLNIIVIMILISMIIACAKNEKKEAFLFYEAVCPSCEETQRMQDLAGSVAYWGSLQKNVSTMTYDIIHTTGAMDILSELCVKYTIDPLTVQLPVLFFGGTVYQGYDDIKAFIK